MIAGRTLLVPRALLAALSVRAGGLDRLDGQGAPPLTVVQPPAFSPAMGRDYRLQLQHTIHMILRGQLQKIAASRPAPRPAPPSAAPPRTVVELRIHRPGAGTGQVSTTLTSPVAAASRWQGDVVRLLTRLTEVNREVIPRQSRPHRLHPPVAPGVPRLPSPWSRPPSRMPAPLWFSTIRDVGDYLLQRSRTLAPPAVQHRAGLLSDRQSQTRPWTPPAAGPAARQATYLVLAVPGQNSQANPMAIGLSLYQPRQGTLLAYRRAARSTGPEIQQQIHKITRHVQSRIIHDVNQSLPWRGELREALRSPDLLRLLTDQISRAIHRRDGVDRYRRGQ
ncbi:hypothetical protein [Paramagnetospirillum magneticum]|uniref:Uncharacterized protein n=1 Tax=Paramagnetospirillum magneticum (strain ATCC 700264 / AMB-1) TaxID=342108 RepID=Q2W632_PARM1|nr:hypothetical protein [Paramagnetospirillum magneticum]BAE50693.1 hypothetical protein amb1889 [Paramagnetospirillum magneticum AMB-1]